ncbi:hypothetical protein [Flavimaricola marinus]|uniref:IgA FC receptor n=1 Tax=Flavimaricola marinus TaxID=1819565 RepID=A0A238LDF7_9RHOB|nr:hypothetical protein [Flavimaricola marinus]SMY07583.1 hypothetical protein LOM8899_01719 [Flavimaricola marinus]
MRLVRIITIALAPLLLSTSGVFAAPASVWDGPGPRACMGRCSVEWAMSHLSEERQAAVAAAMEEAPMGYSIPITDGATFSMMSYYDQEPRADMRSTVAALDAPEPATGWQFDGWAFVKIAGCQNWAVLLDAPPVLDALGPATGETPLPTAYSPSTGPGQTSFIVPTSTTTVPGTSGTPVVIDTSETVTPTDETPTPTDPTTPVDTVDPETPPVVIDVVDVVDPGDEIDPVGPFPPVDPPTPPIIPIVDPDPPVTPSPVPLPSSLSFLLLSLMALAVWGRSRRGRG